MTGRGHRRVNLVTAPAVWIAMMEITSPLLSLIVASCYLASCRLPDHLECRIDYHNTLIPHRTITHWGVLWVAIAALGYGWMAQATWMLPFAYSETAQLLIGGVLFGCALGSLMHLLMDAPDHMGVPWFLFWVRHRLRWWRSGRFETPIVAAMATASLSYIMAHGTEPAMLVMQNLSRSL